MRNIQIAILELPLGVVFKATRREMKRRRESLLLPFPFALFLFSIFYFPLSHLFFACMLKGYAAVLWCHSLYASSTSSMCGWCVSSASPPTLPGTPATPPCVCTGQTDANWGTPCNLIKGGPLSKTSRVCRRGGGGCKQIPQHFAPTWKGWAGSGRGGGKLDRRLIYQVASKQTRAHCYYWYYCEINDGA